MRFIFAALISVPRFILDRSKVSEEPGRYLLRIS
jgi:hypothetical protein